MLGWLFGDGQRTLYPFVIEYYLDKPNSIWNIQHKRQLAEAIFLPSLSMHRVKIKIRMLEQGIYTQKALAEKLGVNPSTVTRLLKGQRRSRRLEKEIAEILGMAGGGNRREKK